MEKMYYFRKLTYLVFAIFILTGCRKKDIEADPVVPIGKSYITVEQDGLRKTYIEGEPGVEPLNLFGTSTQHANKGHGGGIKINDVSWQFFFYFSQDEYEQNTGNFSKLFKPGKLPYLSLNRSFDYTNIYGVTVNRHQQLTDSTGAGANSEYQENSNPQDFEITDAYFYNSTYDRFIWVEGTFNCSIGFFEDLKRVKGKFRIKVQHNEE